MIIKVDKIELVILISNGITAQLQVTVDGNTHTYFTVENLSVEEAFIAKEMCEDKTKNKALLNKNHEKLKGLSRFLINNIKDNTINVRDVTNAPRIDYSGYIHITNDGLTMTHQVPSSTGNLWITSDNTGSLVTSGTSNITLSEQDDIDECME